MSPAERPPLLDAADLAVALGGVEAVRGVDLRMDGPGWLGILGANGSGKTTLLRGLAGRVRLDRGSVRVNGEDLTARLDRRARRIVLAPDVAALPLELTGAELVALTAAARRARPDEPREVLEALEYPRIARLRVSAMSAGMRQRLALCLAFLGRPDVVLLDEPFNWLDPVAAYDLREALQARVAAGLALITALHEVSTFLTRCDDGLLLQGGRIIRRFGAPELRAGAADLLGFERSLRDLFARPAAEAGS